MSTIHRQPSGPVVACTGRNQLSVDARNSSFVVGAMAFEGRAFRRQFQTMHNEVDRLADERVALEVVAEQIVAVDAQAARRGHVARRPAEREMPRGLIDREQLVRFGPAGTNTADGGDVTCGLRFR